jgi:membrane fusion protein, multidrug efflux system
MSRVSFILAIAGVIVLAAWLATSLPHAKALSPQKKDTPSVLVTLTELHKGSLPRTVTAFGTVEASAEEKHTVMAPVSAIIDTVFVKPGEEVGSRAPLISLGPSPGTAATYTKAVSALHAARALVKRTQDLLSQHLATQQQLADAQKSVADAQATLSELKSEGAAGPRILRAPFRSIVTAISTTPGAIVNQGTALLDLARPSELVLHAGVVPDNAKEIKTGDPTSVTPLGETHAVSGKVSLRSSMVDPRTGLVSVDITLPNGALLPGQMAEARIVSGTVRGYVVPHEAILVDDNGDSYVVQSTNMIAHRVVVKVLLSAGSQDVVAGPLDPNAPLVLAGNYQLENGTKIRLGPTPTERQ